MYSKSQLNVMADIIMNETYQKLWNDIFKVA